MTKLLVLSLYFFSHAVFAWGPLGHKAICDASWRASQQVIQDELKNAAKRLGYKTFAESCLWPDQVRRQKKYAWSRPLHYMNVSRRNNNLGDDPCNDKHLSKPRCVLSAITYYHKRWLDTSLSREERDEALLLMSHFVADIHQPLHVAYAEDRGGTRKQVVFGGKLMSLHSLWDSDILYCGTRASWRTLGKQLYREQVNYKNSSLYSNDWASESFALTRRIYTGANKKLPDKYCEQFHSVAVTRLVLASVRLTGLLNSTDNSEIERKSSGEGEADEVQFAPNLTSKFSALWKLILTLLP